MSALPVEVPDDMMERLRALADKEFRTPEGQVLWLIKTALDAADRREARPTGERSQVDREQRIRAAQPVFDQLRTAHLLAGGPSSRVLANVIWEKTNTRVSHTTVNGVINGAVPPSWRVLESIVKALDGDTGHFRQLWAEANRMN
jgi:hypothetical protein